MSSAPDAEDVRAALGRLSVSAVFAGAERMRRFLQLVVEETIAGNAGSLKEYRIGVDVFDRGQTFDPRTDTIVRVEARRLRKKLEEYYAGTGRHDPLIIRVLPGGYIPSFVNRAAEDATSPGPESRERSTVPHASIAVLPFLDLSEAGDQEYLCDGFSEELLNALSRIPALKVAARTSAFRFKGKAADIPRIGTALGVEHILEGSVRLFGPRMRVTVQLLRASDGYHVWSRQFDRLFAEALSLQSDVATQVAASVGVELGSGGSAASCGAEAYRSYLEGRHDWRQFTPASTVRAVDCFERSIRLEPSFAPAHAGLADAYMQMSVFGMAAPRDLAEKARTAANRALALDPRSVEALTQLGAVSAYCDWDWSSSEEHFRRALHIQPNYVDARWLMATVCLGPQQRLDEALLEAREAARQDPLSPLTQAMVGAVHLYRCEYDAALAALDAADVIAPSFSQTSLFRGFVNLARGRPDLAAVGQDHSPYRLYVQARLGHTAAVRAEIEVLRTGRGSPLVIAAGYAGLDDVDHSLEWLERAADLKVPQLIWIDFQPPWERLRGCERFEDIRKRMHLPSPHATSQAPR